jgi:hypothetical protein
MIALQVAAVLQANGRTTAEKGLNVRYGMLNCVRWPVGQSWAVRLGNDGVPRWDAKRVGLRNWQTARTFRG